MSFSEEATLVLNSTDVTGRTLRTRITASELAVKGTKDPYTLPESAARDHHGCVQYVYLHWRNFTLKSGGDQWRRQDLVSGGHDDRGAEGAELGGVWGGVSAPQPTRGFGGAS